MAVLLIHSTCWRKRPLRFSLQHQTVAIYTNCRAKGFFEYIVPEFSVHQAVMIGGDGMCGCSVNTLYEKTIKIQPSTPNKTPYTILAAVKQKLFQVCSPRAFHTPSRKGRVIKYFVSVPFHWLILSRSYLISRELKRLSTVTLSPVYAHFSESLAGLSTIRALRASDRFIAENEARVNVNQRANFGSKQHFLIILCYTV